MEERERKAASEDAPHTSKQTGGLKPCEQAATSQESSTNLTSEDDVDHVEKRLDISSDKFDPLLALYSPQISLPYPNIKCFNNIADYESFLKGGSGRAKPENVEKRQRKAQKGVSDPERAERLKKLMVNKPEDATGEEEGKGATRNPGKRKARKNVLTRMPLHEGSPLGQLNRCVQERIRVKVHIRTFKGLRGVCSGFVVAFDKFWNMAMVDVDETYREPLLGEALYHEKALTVTRLFEKLQVQEAQGLSTAEEQYRSESTVKTSKPGDLSSESQSAARSKIRKNDPKQAAERMAMAGKAEPRPDSGSAHTPKVSKPKEKYGKVRTRHVNQLFIRGENILLVNIKQD